MAEAAILKLADEVRAMLADELPEPARVSRSYTPDLDRKNLTGRLVWVIPAAYLDAARVARKRVHTGNKLAVVVAERYEEPAQADPDEPVPNEWVDERVDWVKAHVFDLLNNTGIEQADRLLGRFWPHTCEQSIVFDVDKLGHEKTFWSLTEVEYREQVEG